jgi:hypothetical protein
VPPLDPGAVDERRDDRAGHADARDDGRAPASACLAHQLAHERDPRAELAREPDARDEAQRRVLVERGDQPVRDVREGVHDDAAEQHREAPAPVAEHAPDDPPDEHPQHLPIEQSREPRLDLAGATPSEARLFRPTTLNRMRS